MPAKKSPGDVVQTLRKFALRLSNTEEGIACADTAVESRTIKVNGKAFLFLRSVELRFKLRDSLPEILKAATQDSRYQAGAGGWCKVVLDGTSHPIKVLERWIAESYQLMAGPQPKSQPSRKTAKASKRSKK